MADPAYIVDGVLTDGEAWVALASNEPDGSANSVGFTDPSDGSSLDWCQFMDFVVICYVRGAKSGVAQEGFKFILISLGTDRRLFRCDDLPELLVRQTRGCARSRR